MQILKINKDEPIALHDQVAAERYVEQSLKVRPLRASVFHQRST
jgi:hypothetical protein